jgi:sugar/nucleoside kinase (ribokinase family)
VYDVASGQTTGWSAAAGPVVDATGAGDSFAGGMLSGLLGGLPLVEALQRGVVSASFALAGHGPDALLAATRADAQARQAELALAS